MSTISNISGTTMPSFKLKANGGIELISAAIKNEEGKVISNKFKVKTTEIDANGVKKSALHEVAYYDTHIASSEIRCIEHKNGGLIIHLRSGGNITLDNLINKEKITFNTEDENYKKGQIVVIDDAGTDKTKLAGSGYQIINSYTNGVDEEKSVPTVRAVKSIAKNVFDTETIGLSERVNGDNVTLV